MDIPRSKVVPMMIFLISFFTAQAGAHMIMANPVPYGYETIDNSPLTSSNYPCKVTSDPATFYSQSGIDNTYAAGSVQSLSFKGSAVHGGGSCQLAITNDMQPSESTDWRVILSIESGCPSTDGTNVGTYNWTVPEDLEAGQYSFAWTWISKLAGQGEFYMNCAPITVTSSGSSSKRSGSDLASRASESDYPELFVANLDSINSCTTTPGTDVVYPDPGPNVEKLLTGATPSYATISQAGCVPKSQSQDASSLPTATAGGSSGGSSAGSSSAAMGGIFATTTTQQATTATTLVTTTSTAGESTSTSTTTSEALSVYVSPVVQSSSSKSDASSSTSAAAATTATSSSSSSAGFATGPSASSTTQTVQTETSATAATTSSAVLSSSSAASASSTLLSSTLTSSSASATATGSGSGSGSGGNSTSSATTKTGTCSDEGTFNCVGDQYQQCASGAWTAMRALPAGTTCQQGESTTLWARGVAGVRSRVNVNLLRKVRKGDTAAVGVGQGRFGR